MLRHDVHDALRQYDGTLQGRVDTLAGLRECGRRARAAGVTAEALALTIRSVWWDDPTIEVWGESVLVPMCTALLAYYGED
jgi:hypothetical protein